MSFRPQTANPVKNNLSAPQDTTAIPSLPGKTIYLSVNGINRLQGVGMTVGIRKCCSIPIKTAVVFLLGVYNSILTIVINECFDFFSIFQKPSWGCENLQMPQIFSDWLMIENSFH